MDGLTVYTIGHSTRELHQLLSLLQEHAIALLADVRTLPRSRRNPQFNKDLLAAVLPKEGIRYCHLPGLGGLRKGQGAISPNTAWRNPSFQGYADYMLTPAFDFALEELIALALAQTTAFMCAEAVPWRCHRSLIADALAVRQVAVYHITGPGRGDPHRLTPSARVQGQRITYPAP